jgi:catechol 2,3-dioxygenase
MTSPDTTVAADSARRQSSDPQRSAAGPVLANAPHRVGKVTLTIRDLDRVAAFYQDVIGLEVLEQEPTLVRLGAGGSVLLELRQDPHARFRSPHDAGLFHTAFLLPSRADLGAWLGAAAERRIPIHGASDHLVSEAIYLADPEGNGIEVYADRPSATWTRNNGMLVMPSEPLDVQDLLCAAAGRAWSNFPATGTVGHVHLQVGAIAPAEAFYGDVLGFDITCRYPGGSFYGSGGYHHQLATNIWNSRGAPVRQEPTTGLADVEIIAEPPVLDAVRSRLPQEQTGAGSPTQLSLRDPWGTSITMVSADR